MSMRLELIKDLQEIGVLLDEQFFRLEHNRNSTLKYKVMAENTTLKYKINALVLKINNKMK